MPQLSPSSGLSIFLFSTLILAFVMINLTSSTDRPLKFLLKNISKKTFTFS
uniref:ATP synthase F0 subunit 8 n=1 Tax=Ambigolimax valentianus TaxID=1338344 RepID=UPI002410D745|nr:ATP synthase F0 subunit 8 [Ambigolimax valentianus]WEI33080.1 ATP synthase F0 subunit 8 [Ambigolimax valentianus]